jgi:hypothetical protein
LPVDIMVSEDAPLSALAKRGVARVSYGADPYVVTMKALRRQHAKRSSVRRTPYNMIRLLSSREHNMRRVLRGLVLGHRES